MTNYYNILGLEQDADVKEIKQAYRKLSKKFHPDLNQDDAFFDKMFLQIQEAYEVLSDKDLRVKYDQILNQTFTQVERKIPSKSMVPLIENFSVDKQAVEPKEEFTVTWKVKNADFVQIRPLGVFPNEGFEKFQFNKFKGKSIHLILIATNSSTGTSARKHIEILNKKWKPSFFEDDKKTQITINILKILFILIILAFILSILVFGIQKDDPTQGFPKN